MFDFRISYCFGKSHRQPFTGSSTKYTKPLQLIYIDIWGPTFHPSLDGYKYYVHFNDAFSCYTWFHPLNAKSDVYSIFLKFKTLVSLQFDAKILDVKSNGRAEFLKNRNVSSN